MNKQLATIDISPSNATHVGSVLLKINRTFVTFSLRFKIIWDSDNAVFKNISFDVSGCSLFEKRNEFNLVKVTVEYVAKFYNLKVLRCPFSAGVYILRKPQINPEMTFPFLDVLPNKMEGQAHVIMIGKFTRSSKAVIFGRFIENFAITKVNT